MFEQFESDRIAEFVGLHSNLKSSIIKGSNLSQRINGDIAWESTNATDSRNAIALTPNGLSVEAPSPATIMTNRDSEYMMDEPVSAATVKLRSPGPKSAWMHTPQRGRNAQTTLKIHESPRENYESPGIRVSEPFSNIRETFNTTARKVIRGKTYDPNPEVMSRHVGS